LSIFLFNVTGFVLGSSCVFTCAGSTARQRNVSSCQRDCLPARVCSGNVSFLGYCFSSSPPTTEVYLSFWGELRPELSTETTRCPATISATLSLSSSTIEPGSLCSGRCCEEGADLSSSALAVELSGYKLLAESSLASSLPASCYSGTQFYYVLAGQGSFNQQIINDSMVVMYMPLVSTSCVYVLPTLSA
jgi:hypothetical protein